MADIPKQVAELATLSVLIMAPFGSVLCRLLGPCLLQKPSRCCQQDSDKVDLTWDDQLDFSQQDVVKPRGSELSNMSTVTVEITTERETVT